MSDAPLVPTPRPPPRAPTERPPGPSGGHPIYGNLWEFHEDPVAFQMRVVRECGDIARFRFFHLPVYLLANPEDIRTVFVDPEGAFIKGMALDGFRPLVGKGLLLNEGDSHRRQRRMMQPAFHRARVAGYGEVMVEEARALSARWATEVAAGKARVDMDTEMNRLTLTIAARTLFGAGITDTEARDVAEAMSAFTQWYHQSTHPFGALLQALPTEATRSFKAAKRKLGAVVDRMIASRRAGGDTGGTSSRCSCSRVTPTGMAPQCPTNTCTTRRSPCSSPATRPPAPPSPGPGPSSPITPTSPRSCAPRSMRSGTSPPWRTCPASRTPAACSPRRSASTPPRPRSPARPSSPSSSAATPSRRAPSSSAAAWSCHHDPRFWDDPAAFRPERWLDTSATTRPKFAFFPFGGGARVCIGEAFAWMEGTLLLATLARAWSATVAPGHKVIPEALFTVRPKGGLPMTTLVPAARSEPSDVPTGAARA